MLSNAYFLAKFRFDTAENEPAKNLQDFSRLSIQAAGDRRLAARSEQATLLLRHPARLSRSRWPAQVAYTHWIGSRLSYFGRGFVPIPMRT